MIFQDAAAYAASGFVPKVCIVGSGPAGITVANKLAEAGIPSVIFEAGSDEFTEESQDFYRGTVVGDPYFKLEDARLRYFGGSSNHWAGWTQVLETYDFEPRSYVEHSGWPIGRKDIEPFLAETFDILELDAFRPDVKKTADFSRFEMKRRPPVRFGEKYAGPLGQSASIALVLNTEITELAGNGKMVTGAKLLSRGVASEVSAQYYVVATGGLENSRLLLWSNERSNGGVVPQAAALGRYWMEHHMYWGGDAFLTDTDAIAFDEEGDAFFKASPETLTRLGIMNFHIQLESVPFHGVKRFIADIACEAPETTEWVSHKLGQRLQCSSRVHVAWEQAPKPENRVMLSSTERDATGMPRIELHWKKDELDRRTMVEALRLFGENLAQSDLGRMRVADWVTNGEFYPDGMELAGNHHMGGTRMSDDPAFGVVDRDCKVHGMENLFIGGSSVFASSGQCTPTTTLTTLAVRLGHHLAGTVRNS